MKASQAQRRNHAAQNGKNAHAKRTNGAQARGAESANTAPNGRQSGGNTNHRSVGWFTLFAQKTAQIAGRPGIFILATSIIVVWALSGPLFGFSDTWQLVINTGTTIITFLMVFLIQHTQNRDALAFQVKLDELIIKLRGAGNELAGAEDLCDEELEALHEKYRKRAAAAHEVLEKRRTAR